MLCNFVFVIIVSVSFNDNLPHVALDFFEFKIQTPMHCSFIRSCSFSFCHSFNQGLICFSLYSRGFLFF